MMVSWVHVVERSSTHGLLLGQIAGRAEDDDDGVVLEFQGAVGSF